MDAGAAGSLTGATELFRFWVFPDCTFLDISTYFTLADWRSIRRNTPPAKPLSAEEQIIRIRELERENAELRTANDILKDALGFFAKDRKK